MFGALARLTEFPLLPDDHTAAQRLEEQRARCESELLDEVSATLARIAAQATEDIVDALVQLAAGTYGYCLDCHKAIPAGRLDALVLAVRCVACERARETSAMNRDTSPLPLATVE